jgi:hypothetical protein
MSQAFETRKRDNGDKYVALKDGSPEWMTDVCHKAHGDMLPDDWRYSFISEAVDYIDENGAGECDYCHSVVGERQATITDGRGYLYCSRYCVSRAYPEVEEGK